MFPSIQISGLSLSCKTEQRSATILTYSGILRNCLITGPIPDYIGELSDLKILIYSDESSWKRATELLVEVASHGEATGYEVPCLIVAAKDDLDPFPTGIHDSTRHQSKQEFNGNYSVQVYTVQACIPKYPAALWNAEFVQAEELLRQPSTIDNCFFVTLGI
ncbi:unnamed protein product [Camellia sinensis]